jgi:hypothetical protein
MENHLFNIQLVDLEFCSFKDSNALSGLWAES